MSRKEAVEEYAKALKEGQKEYKECLQKQIEPNPVVLDEILDPECSETCIQIGLVEIPTKRIIGTKTAGRVSAFTPSFRPLLEPETEFALKWVSLCDDNLSDVGIQQQGVRPRDAAVLPAQHIAEVVDVHPVKIRLHHLRGDAADPELIARHAIGAGQLLDHFCQIQSLYTSFCL